jgi:hypothetical protein
MGQLEWTARKKSGNFGREVGMFMFLIEGVRESDFESQREDWGGSAKERK